MKRPPELPRFVQRFLRTGVNRRTRLLVYALHRWLDRRRLTLAECEIHSIVNAETAAS